MDKKHDKVDTMIVGLQSAGFNLDEVAKRFKKDLNTSVTVLRGYNFNGVHGDVIEVRGDITDKIVGILLMKLKVEKTQVRIIPKQQDPTEK